MSKAIILSAIRLAKQRKKDTGLFHQIVMTKGKFQVIVDNTYTIQIKLI